jgi:hypothetical protein
MARGTSLGGKTVFLHVGCRKSGTSALQLGLSRGADQLRAHGMAQPLAGRGEVVRGLVKPLEGARGGDESAAREAVAKLASTIRRSNQPRHLITLEALAELPPEATSIVIQGLAEFDTRVVLTVRPWALTIPSEWQQLVKSRFTGEYGDFTAAVVAPDRAEGILAEEARRFHRRQDMSDIVRRWRAADPELPVHVVLVPSDLDTRPDLNQLFCEVVGSDSAHLAVPERMVNQSLSHQDAEVLRRVNLALGDRLQNLRGNYRYSVRKWIAVDAMMRKSGGSRIRLPQELEEWACKESARQLKAVVSAGCHVVGDAESYLHPTLRGDDFVPATDAEIVEAAAATLANLAENRERARRRERQRTRRRDVGKQPRSPETAAGVAHALLRNRRALRRTLRRARARIGRR